MAQETLHCRAGHDFKRDRVRGKKPVWCPEHRPNAVVAPKARREARTATQDGEATPAPKLVSGPENRSDLAPIFASPNVNPETKRKLRYIEAELDNKREIGDINLLTKTRKELVRDASRGLRVPVLEAA